MSSWINPLAGKRLVGDTESDNLLDKITRFWTAHFINIDAPEETLTLTPETIHHLPQIVQEASLVVFHNVTFDVPAIEKVYGVKIDRKKTRCSLVMSRLANSAREGGHSIEAWGNRFGIPKPVHEDWTQYSEEMGVRVIADAKIGFLTLKAILKELKGFSKESIDIEHELNWLLHDAKEAGFWLDEAKAHDLYVTVKGMADDYLARIQKAFPRRSKLVREIEPKVTKSGAYSLTNIKMLGDQAKDVGGPFSLIEWEDFNVDSPVQRVERLTSVGWIASQRTKPSASHPQGQPKFTAEDIEDLDGIPEEAKLIGKYLICRNRERTVADWLNRADKNGYAHPTILHIGTWTQRMSHSSPQLGNPPKVHTTEIDGVEVPIFGLEGGFGYECRDCWGVPYELRDRYVLVGMDLAGIQLRGFAHYTGNREYAALVSNPKVKIHQVHSEYLDNIGYKKAKTFVYAYLLGMGDAKAGLIVGGSAKDGKAAKEMFAEKVPGLKQLRETTIPKWARQGYLVGLDGRHVPAPSEHLALAAALQSFEKIVMAHSVIGLQRQLDTLAIPFQLRALPHDEIQATTLKTKVDMVTKMFDDTVRGTGERFGSICELASDAKVGFTWSETH